MSSKKAEARERVKAMREEQQRKERARERMMRFGVAGAVVAAVAIIAVAVAASRGGSDATAVPESAAAGNGQVIDGDGKGILVGDPAAPVTIDYWMDFLCPHCAEFEAANAATVDELVESGQANIVYHPLTFTGGAYSTRANGAFACAADEGMASEFAAAAFASQQQWSSSSLVDLGEQAGIGGDYESCVRDDTYEDWSSAVGTTPQEFQVEGTPTVFINAQSIGQAPYTPEQLTSAVETVAAGGTLTPPTGETPPATPPATTPPAGQTTPPAATTPPASPSGTSTP